MKEYTNHISDSKEKVFHLSTFFFLYIAQSIPMSFFSTAIQVLMRQAEFSLSSIAMLQIIKLPWVLKFLWAPMVDKRCHSIGDYKRFIIGSELVYAGLIFIAGMLQLSDNFSLIMTLVVLSFIASATQDIATDALAVRIFERQDKSLLNSMQSMGSFGGTLLGGGALLLILHRFGWHVVLSCLALFVLVATIPLLTNRRLQFQQAEQRPQAHWADFAYFFARRSVWKQVGFLVLYYTGIIGILSILRPYLVDLGYSMDEIGFMSGVTGTATAFVASFLCGLLIRRTGCTHTRILIAVLILFTSLFFLMLSRIVPDTWHIYIAIMLLWGSYGCATVVVYTTSMEYVRDGREGTDFTVQTVITHLVGIIIAIASGKLADKWGYSTLFAFETAIATLSLLYVCIVRPPKKKPVIKK